MKKYLTTAVTAVILTGGTLDAFDLNRLADSAAKTAATPKTASQDSALIRQLTSRLGITPAQAGGGAAALFGQAKQKMKPADFSRLTAAVPEVSSLLNSPALAGLGEHLSLSKQFAALGLDSATAAQFTPVILGYVKQLAGPEVSQLLAAAL